MQQEIEEEYKKDAMVSPSKKINSKKEKQCEGLTSDESGGDDDQSDQESDGGKMPNKQQKVKNGRAASEGSTPIESEEDDFEEYGH